MAVPNPFKNPPFSPKGDADADSLHLAVGRALNAWEHAESGFAHLFGTIIRPTRNSYAARRAYGSITSSFARRQMLEAVGAVFFRNFPNVEAQDNMKLLLMHYIDAGARRNELAHGIVGGDRGEDGEFLGYFVVPSAWTTKKRALDSAMSYRYSCKEIHEKQNGFNEIGGRAIAVADKIDAVFQSSPEKHRKRW